MVDNLKGNDFNQFSVKSLSADGVATVAKLAKASEDRLETLNNDTLAFVWKLKKRNVQCPRIYPILDAFREKISSLTSLLSIVQAGGGLDAVKYSKAVDILAKANITVPCTFEVFNFKSLTDKSYRFGKFRDLAELFTTQGERFPTATLESRVQFNRFILEGLLLRSWSACASAATGNDDDHLKHAIDSARDLLVCLNQVS